MPSCGRATGRLCHFPKSRKWKISAAVVYKHATFQPAIDFNVPRSKPILHGQQDTITRMGSTKVVLINQMGKSRLERMCFSITANMILIPVNEICFIPFKTQFGSVIVKCMAVTRGAQTDLWSVITRPAVLIGPLFNSGYLSNCWTGKGDIRWAGIHSLLPHSSSGNACATRESSEVTRRYFDVPAFLGAAQQALWRR